MQLATSPTITTRIVLKNKMGVKLGAAITPMLFTSTIMNRSSRCNNIYTINNKRIIVVLDFR